MSRSLHARIRELEIALVQAAVPLEVLSRMITDKPYREISEDLQDEIVSVIPLIRAAVGNHQSRYPNADTKFTVLE